MRNGQERITFQEFQKLELVEQLRLPLGTQVRRVPVGRLLTTQQQLDQEQAKEVVAGLQEGRFLNRLLSARTIFLPDKIGTFFLLTDSGSHQAAVVLANTQKKEKFDLLLLGEPKLFRTDSGYVRPIRELVNGSSGALRVRPEVDYITDIQRHPEREEWHIVQFNHDPRSSCPVCILGIEEDVVRFLRPLGKEPTMGVARLSEDLWKKWR